MSVAVSQQPQNYTPGYSPQWFTALSDQIAQDDFSYTVVCTDLITSETQTYEIPQRPDGYCVFDAGPFAESRLTHYIPKNETGWKLATGIRKIRVNIGETYGGVYASGADIDYQVWNAVSDHKDYPSFDYNDFVYATGGNEIVLSSTLRDKTFEDRSNYLYVLTEGDSFAQLTIETFLVDGSAGTTSFIPNPYATSTNYREKYLCIDVGHKGLTNISPSLVTGAFPVLNETVAYYKLYSDSELIKIIDYECEHKYDVYAVHYLKKNGAFQTLNFSKRSDFEIKKQVTSYKKSPYELESGEYVYDPSEHVERVLSTLSTHGLKLNTDWLTPEEVESHQDLIDAPLVYLDLGLVDYIPLKVVTNSYKLNKRYNERMFSLSVDFEYAYDNTRQRC